MPLSYICVSEKCAEAFKHVRHFGENEIDIYKTKLLGKGAFGKCFVGSVGPQKACVKVMRKGEVMDSSFKNEASILSLCCHPNIPLLFGVLVGGFNCILMSFHGHDANSFSVRGLLGADVPDVCEYLSLQDWKVLIVDVTKALKYLHTHTKGAILHNDLKDDNVVVDFLPTIKAVIVDFGKASFECHGKRYLLSEAEKLKYQKHHPQIAPDVRDGSVKQSKASDIFSFGRIITDINKKKLSIAAVTSMADLCLEYSGMKRPLTNDLLTFFNNLFE